MNAKRKVDAETINQQVLSVLEYHGAKILFQEIDGKIMVNATQMAKPFRQKPQLWLRTQQSKDLIKAVSVVQKCNTADLQIVKQGGKPELQGTWFHEDVALFFAQWLSPQFYLACNTKLKELLVKEARQNPIKYGVEGMFINGEKIFPYNVACKKLGNIKYPKASKRKQRNPKHFKMIYGRNFITEHYLDLLKGYYSYRKVITNQLALELVADVSKVEDKEVRFNLMQKLGL